MSKAIFEVSENEILQSKQVFLYIVKRLHKVVRIDDLMLLTGMHRVKLTKVSKEVRGVTPIKMYWTLKTRIGANLLYALKGEKVSNIAEYMNFKNQEHFCKKIKEIYRVGPRELRYLSKEDFLNQNQLEKFGINFFEDEMKYFDIHSDVFLIREYIRLYSENCSDVLENDCNIYENFIKLSSVDRTKLIKLSE